ncbi:MAG: phage tail assembly chaperone [Sphingomonadales bacterium]|nr:MAG: phage tail assembly chaperone [Sphingomonadales bacterium]
MSGRFGAGTARLIAASAQLLSWTPETFWRATPEELLTALGHPSGPISDAITREDIDKLIEGERHG